MARDVADVVEALYFFVSASIAFGPLAQVAGLKNRTIMKQSQRTWDQHFRRPEDYTLNKNSANVNSELAQDPRAIVSNYAKAGILSLASENSIKTKRHVYNASVLWK